MDDHGDVHLLAVVAHVLNHGAQGVWAGGDVVVRPARVVELGQVVLLSALLRPQVPHQEVLLDLLLTLLLAGKSCHLFIYLFIY